MLLYLAEYAKTPGGAEYTNTQRGAGEGTVGEDETSIEDAIQPEEPQRCIAFFGVLDKWDGA